LLSAAAVGVSAAVLYRYRRGRRRGGSSRKSLVGAEPPVARAPLAGPPPGTKKGVGMATGKPNKPKSSEKTRLQGSWHERVAALRPSWFYSWGPGGPEVMAKLPPGVEFVPMVWGGNRVDGVRPGGTTCARAELGIAPFVPNAATGRLALRRTVVNAAATSPVPAVSTGGAKAAGRGLCCR